MDFSNSQKFIGRNRAPRVQIEYDVELYGSEKKVELPFVMGVMADLSGAPTAELADVSEREFAEIDIDNFDAVLKSTAPRVSFHVPNLIQGDKNIAVDITFSELEDFSPAAVAEKVDALKKLLDARKQLSDLLTYMDGKSSAENAISEILAKASDGSLLKQGLLEQLAPDPSKPSVG